jgi:hypothetical protein
MMGFRIVFRRWWSPPLIIFQKPFHVPPCTSTCSGAPFWKPSYSLIHKELLIKIGDTRPWVYDTRTRNRFEHENQSSLSGVVTTVSPFPSSRTVTTRRYSWLDLWWTRCVEWIQGSIGGSTPLRHGS